MSPSGDPLGFRDVDDETRRDIWSRSCLDPEARQPYVTLLVTLHTIRLHQDRVGRPGWDEWLRLLEERRDELLDSTRLSAEEAEADYAWLELADACSLQLCGGRSESFHILDFEGSGGAIEPAAEPSRILRLNPFPLAGATSFRVPCRRIERRRYDSDRDLGRSLANARWSRRRVSIAPVEG